MLAVPTQSAAPATPALSAAPAAPTSVAAPATPTLLDSPATQDAPRRAWRTQSADLWITLVVGIGMTLVALDQLAFVLHPAPIRRLALTVPVALFLVWQFVFSAAASRNRVAVNATQDVDRLSVVALVPVYNEDPTALRQCLASMLGQTRPLQAISVVDDGSSDFADYEPVREWFALAGIEAGVRTHWQRQENAGKRVAQLRGLEREPDADVYVTVDSDSILDPHATERAISCFADAEIQSVAAIILTTNYRTNLLTRVTDLYCVSLQVFERSALSAFGSVLVNCGGCAFYRGDILRDNAEVYRSETLFGRPMRISDDSLLTLFALERGKAVQHPEAFAFTLMPETVNHMRRQQLRWMRGSFIRSGWRMRHLPLTRPAFWLHLARWLQFALVTAGLVTLALSGAFAHPQVWLAAIVSSIGMYILVAARYLAIRRSDQTTRQRWAVFATAPLAALWSATMLRVLRWYAMATFAHIGRWGTRSTVEVAAPMSS